MTYPKKSFESGKVLLPSCSDNLNQLNGKPILGHIIKWTIAEGFQHSGLDNVLGTANGLVHRKLTRLCTIEMGEPFQPFIYGQVGFPLQIFVGYDIPLIMDGENGEAEYGGDPTSETKAGFNFDDNDAY